MELAIRDGDYVRGGTGRLCRVSGREELLQRVLFKLTAHRGGFPFLETLGSRLWQLGRLPARERQGAAEQYVAEALEGEPLSVEKVELTPLPEGRAVLTVFLLWRGELLSVAVDLQQD